MRPLFYQVTIVGLGLIGGSLALALKKNRLARCVVGITRRSSTLRQALKRRAIDRGSLHLRDGLDQSDLVVIATPPLTVVKIAQRICRFTRHRFLLTDVASTKSDIVRELERLLPARISFIGGHPMAGSERTGIGSAQAKLFQGAPCVLTPTPKSSRQALAKISQLWRSVGGRIVTLSPLRHDDLVAQVSHVPHLAAVALTLLPQREALRVAAGGFADSTRIALSDPFLWREICFTNTEAITKTLHRLLRQIEELRGQLSRGESARILKALRAAQRRRQLIA